MQAAAEAAIEATTASMIMVAVTATGAAAAADIATEATTAAVIIAAVTAKGAWLKSVVQNIRISDTRGRDNGNCDG